MVPQLRCLGQLYRLYGLSQPTRVSLQPLLRGRDGYQHLRPGIHRFSRSPRDSRLHIPLLQVRDLQCLRNNIHTNLMCTYILADSMWILNMILQGSINNGLAACTIFFLLHYFYLTSFFWMFVEGLYLYLLVVQTFIRETVRLRFYAAIGWGTPMFIVSAWGMAKSFQISDQEENQSHSSGGGCSWMTPHPYDWIYQTPVFTVLALNLLFLIRIMWVLITKLRSANNAETQQYRKASKALIVLIPLLGITYILVIVGPSQGVTAHMYAVLRAVLLSTQGLAVALFYCFFNSEVRNTLRTRMDRWNDARELGTGRRFSRFNYTKDWSPHTRTESIRLCQTVNSAPGSFRKRESTASETTLMTVVGTGSGRVSNGSVGATSLVVRASGPQGQDGGDSV
ncbi:diuretic hormone receptor-like isoform X2 [Macrosteles quadrilineatus]|uniref:diuretic hormone receptor-like isoform X2 n=1 Tax=Macrosteles quadrilineatus TaxID=74068 RepID=UPI0023E2CB07|nr:diuretic hormone receptor-like isoform X2 [Macrosteles quadrilineatus]